MFVLVFAVLSLFLHDVWYIVAMTAMMHFCNGILRKDPIMRSSLHRHRHGPVGTPQFKKNYYLDKHADLFIVNISSQTRECRVNFPFAKTNSEMSANPRPFSTSAVASPLHLTSQLYIQTLKSVSVVGWLAKLLTSRLPLAAVQALNSLIASLLAPIRTKTLRRFNQRFFILRKYHVALAAAVALRALSTIYTALASRDKRALARQLRTQMEAADTYHQWFEAARALDALECRRLPISAAPISALREQTAKLKRMIEADDVHGLMWSLRQDTSRNVGTLLGAAAEQGRVHCLVPPPEIDAYTATCTLALHHVCHASPSTLSLDERLAFVRELRHAYGRTALTLSGGGSFGHWHHGVIKELMLAGLLPRVMSGSSAGAIGCAMLCTRTDDEILESIDAWPTAPNTDFFGAPKGTKGLLKHLFTKGTLHSHEEYTLRLQRLMGDLTFQEAYVRSGRVLNIAVVAADTQEPCRVLNYLTAPNILVWSAVACSSAFPLLFAPQELMMKDAVGNVVPHHHTSMVGGGVGPSTSCGVGLPSAFAPPCTAQEEGDNPPPPPPKSSSPTPLPPPTSSPTPTSSTTSPSALQRRWCDGSLEEDLPMRTLAETFGVNFFLVSQCNPWLVPILAAATYIPRRLFHLLELELKHRCAQLLTMFPRSKILKLVSQPWYGDLNFVLPVTAFPLLRSAVNFTPEEIMKAMREGQKAVWMQLPAVRAACAVEVAVDAELRSLMLQERAARRRDQHAAEVFTNRIRASLPSWMDLKSLGFGVSSADSVIEEEEGEDERKCSGGGGPGGGRSGSSASGASHEEQHGVSTPPSTQSRKNSGSSGSGSGSGNARRQKSVAFVDQVSLIGGEGGAGGEFIDAPVEPWEHPLLTPTTPSTGAPATPQQQQQRGRVPERGLDAWKDMTALVLAGVEGLDYIAP